MPATAGDIRRKAMKKKVDEGYIKQKPGKTNTKVELVCKVCKVFKCNMTVKGVEAKAHPGGKCKGKTLLECFGQECATYYEGGAAGGGGATDKGAKKGLAKAKAFSGPSCKYVKCHYLPSPDPIHEGYCCGKCKRMSLARSAPDHGPQCERKPDGSEC